MRTALAITIAAVALAGCTSTTRSGEILEPKITLTLVGVEGIDVDCHEFSTKNQCHRLLVNLQNDNTKEEAATNLFYWQAAGTNGATFKTPSIEGPDGVQPGAQAEVTVAFDVPAGARIASLEYRAVWMQDPIVVEVPEYTVSAWQPPVSIAAHGVVVKPGNCIFGGNGQCHVVDVTITNGGDEAAGTSSFYWDAVGTDGGGYDVRDVEGPDSVRPGAEATVKVSVALPAGVKVASLEYKDPSEPKPAVGQVASY
jgi:uncharacterized protein YcfL